MLDKAFFPKAKASRPAALTAPEAGLIPGAAQSGLRRGEKENLAMSSWTDKRPMSPHVQVWKWHLTMASSILHRVTGVGNYIGIVLVIAWLFATQGFHTTLDREPTFSTRMRRPRPESVSVMAAPVSR